MARITDMMVDIETTSTEPGFGGILQIAAVGFNYETGEIFQDKIFNDFPSLLPNRFWSDGTQEFWSQHQPVLRDIIAQQKPYMDVFSDFARFCADGEYRFWSKPLSFDWPFLASHFDQLGMMMPFHFRHARDLNTHIAALAGGADHIEMRWVENYHNGELHDALSDCVLQLRMLEFAKKGEFIEHIEAEIVED